MNRTRIAGAALLFLLFGPHVPADEPDINPEFPVNERNISPPSVIGPIHDCARAVHVEGFIAKATIRVFVLGIAAPVGVGSSKLGSADIPLSRALHQGEQVVATQSVGSVTSDPSDPPVPVEKYPLLSKPVITPDVYACGRIARVENLTASTRVSVADLSEPGAPVIGTAENTGAVAPVFTSPLVKDHRLQAVQIACPDEPGKKVASSPSMPVRVKDSPSPPPKPSVAKGFVQGVEVLLLSGLLPGAEIEVKANADVISSAKFATYPDNWLPLDKPIPPGNPLITATQKLCTQSPPSDGVRPERDLPPPVIGERICAGSHFVTVGNVIPGANVVLFWRAAAGGPTIPVGYASAVQGTLKIRVGKGVPGQQLHEGDIVSARQYAGAIVSPASTAVTVGCGGRFNVITQHNDNFRTGGYLEESTLLPDAVLRQGMQKLFTVPLAGGRLTTQPLYVRELQFQGGGANVVFVATLDNWVYQINAGNGTVINRVQLTDPTRAVARGVDTTPVIDVVSNRIYVLFAVAKKVNDSHDPYIPDYRFPGLDKAYWLVALDLRSLTEVARTRISASVYTSAGNQLPFRAEFQIAHPALLLDNGSVYVAFGSDASAEGETSTYLDYHGWVMKYRSADLAFQSALCTTPNPRHRPNKFDPNIKGAGGGIWQGGGGLTADPDGNVFVLTGNGRSETGTNPADPLDVDNGNMADAIIRLTPSAGALVPKPFLPVPPVDPDPDLLEQTDSDLGSGGALVIPGTNFVIGGGKTGWMYLLNRRTMAFQQRLTAATALCNPGARTVGWKGGPHLHGSPTLWQRQGATFLYVWAEKDRLRQFQWSPTTGRFGEPELHSGAVRALEEPMPGGMLSISASGDTPRTGVVWATLPQTNVLEGEKACRLYAFSAEDLKPLWDGDFGLCPHWANPTVADGRVFVPTGGPNGELVVFGLGPSGNRTTWSPTQPQPLCAEIPRPKCLACHTSEALVRLDRQWPVTRRFQNEALLRILPERANRFSKPPADARLLLEIEGSGVQNWRAAPGSAGNLVWTLNGARAELAPPEERRAEGPYASIRVRIEPDGVWTAQDGSALKAVIEKTTPAPFYRDAPWTLLRVVRPASSGGLQGVRYIQSMDTHAGGRPTKPPSRPGEVARVPFFGRYRLYQ